jgi:hypothetical protein
MRAAGTRFAVAQAGQTMTAGSAMAAFMPVFLVMDGPWPPLKVDAQLLLLDIARGDGSLRLSNFTLSNSSLTSVM